MLTVSTAMSIPIPHTPMAANRDDSNVASVQRCVCSPLKQRFTFFISFSVHFTHSTGRFMFKLATTYLNGVFEHSHICVALFRLYLLLQRCMEYTYINVHIKTKKKKKSPTTNAFGTNANEGNFSLRRVEYTHMPFSSSSRIKI